MTDPYLAFLETKRLVDPPTGINPDDAILPDVLFPFQRDLVRWALSRGRAAIFAGTGLGKSLMELSWGNAVAAHTGKSVLLLAPLAVAAQMVREGEKFGVPCRLVGKQSEVADGVNITNYQKLQHFDVSAFGGVILDESSILKNTDGKYRTDLIKQCSSVPFRLAATATPAPNDHMELGNHAEFLGVMSQTDMLATFFTHDGGDTSKWILKGHAQDVFWRWMASWSVMLRTPSDLGYSDDGYNLPPLNYHMHEVHADPVFADGDLFASVSVASSLKERQAAKRDSIAQRVAKAAELVPPGKPCVIWCHLNGEAEALAAAIPGSINLHGSLKDEEKERIMLAFTNGEIDCLITKPSIASMGLNWQCCHETIFVGLNDSWEQLYQAIRRFWRFGQTHPVNVHIISAITEGATLANIQRKDAEAEKMACAMVAHTKDLTSRAVRGSTRENADYNPSMKMEVPSWL